MTKYKEKPAIVNAITWKEFIAYGKEHDPTLAHNFPWSFEYQGYPVTHENDECYLITTDSHIMYMTPEHMLITDIYGAIQVFQTSIFNQMYELAE